MIYADNAATTRISDRAFEKMLPFLREQYGNASSRYSLGVKAKRAVEQARRQVAVAIGADISEITFTSGGSEANSWVIRCVAESYHGKPVHIITSEIEHRSVLNACHALEQTDIEVTYLPCLNYSKAVFCEQGIQTDYGTTSSKKRYTLNKLCDGKIKFQFYGYVSTND